MNHQELLSKTIDRLYQSRRESGLTKYSVVGVFIASIYLLIQNMSLYYRYGWDLIVCVVLVYNIFIVLISLSTESLLNVNKKEFYFFSNLINRRISNQLQLLKFIGWFLFIVFAFIFQYADLELLKIISVINLAGTGFAVLQIYKVEKGFKPFDMPNKIESIFNFDYVYLGQSTSVKTLKHYLLLSSLISLGIGVYFIKDGNIDNLILMIGDAIVIAFCVFGLIGSILLFNIAFTIGNQIATLTSLETKITTSTDINRSDEYWEAQINSYISVPSMEEWFRYQIEMAIQEVNKFKSYCLKVDNIGWPAVLSLDLGDAQPAHF